MNHDNSGFCSKWAKLWLFLLHLSFSIPPGTFPTLCMLMFCRRSSDLIKPFNDVWKISFMLKPILLIHPLTTTHFYSVCVWVPFFSWKPYAVNHTAAVLCHAAAAAAAAQNITLASMLILESWAVIWLDAILFLELQLLPVTWRLNRSSASFSLRFTVGSRFPVWMNILISNTDSSSAPFYDDRNKHFCVCVKQHLLNVYVCVLSLSSHPQSLPPPSSSSLLEHMWLRTV